MKVAVVGATGMVGNVLLQVLREQNFPIKELIPVASEKSVGKQIEYDGISYPVVSLETAVSMKPDVAIFSAGGETSLLWAPKFAEVGTTVIDNSSAWRMDPTKKLIIPEINGDCFWRLPLYIKNTKLNEWLFLPINRLQGLGLKQLNKWKMSEMEFKVKWPTRIQSTKIVFHIATVLKIMAIQRKK